MNQPNINEKKTPRPEQPKSQERHKSSDGGEFERVLDEVYDLYPTHMKDIRSKEIVSRLVSAYYHDRNADRAADKQRIAELEAGVNMYKQSLKTQTAYTDNATKAVMVLKVDAEKRIAELEAQLPKAVTPKRWVSRLGDDMFECPACHRKVKGNLYSHKACQCGAKLDWT